MLNCPCGKWFSGDGPLSQHQRDKGHFYCLPCSRQFRSMKGLEQHEGSVHQRRCGYCVKNYSTQSSLADHQRSTGHCYCWDCDRFFVDDDALTKHLRDSGRHIDEFRCCDCNRDFVSERALEQHLTDKDHGVVPERQVPDNYCEECERVFINEKALQQHRDSKMHQPLSQITCFARGCTKSFTSPSAFLHHLESGSCSSGVNRRKLNALLQEHDQERLISNAGSNEMVTELTRRLENAGELGETTRDYHTDFEVISDGSGWATPSTNSNWEIIPTPNSGSLWSCLASRRPSMDLSDTCPLSRCIMCPPTNPLFCNSQALQQHLASAAHAPRIFYCPITFSSVALRQQQEGQPRVQKTFSTLSGLAQHLESGACEGGMATFRKMVRYVEAKLMELGWNGGLLSDNNPQK